MKTYLIIIAFVTVLYWLAYCFLESTKPNTTGIPHIDGMNDKSDIAKIKTYGLEPIKITFQINGGNY